MKKKVKTSSMMDWGEKNPTHKNDAGEFWLIKEQGNFLLFFAKLKDGHRAYAIAHKKMGWVYENTNLEAACFHLDALVMAEKRIR